MRAREADCEAVQRFKRQGQGPQGTRLPRVFRACKSYSTRIALKAIAHRLSSLAILQHDVLASRSFSNGYPFIGL